MPQSADPLDLFAELDPVGAFWAAHDTRRLISLRTSGTVGQPRAVVRTTTSWTTSFSAVAELAGLSASARLWIPGPMTSTMNLFAHVHAQAMDATVVESGDQATHAVLTPLTLARAVGDEILAPGVTVIVAGDAMRPALLDAARRQRLRVHHYYGASELSFVAWGSEGGPLTAFPGVEIRVSDSIIWARSPFLAVGYRDHDEGGAMRWSDDGYASVGDRGSMTAGVLEVHGRGDKGVTTAGVTVILADIEAALRRVVQGDVVAVGLPDDRLGAVLGVVLTDVEDLEQLRSLTRGWPSVERPRRWFLLPEIPLTPAGKPDRQRIVQMLASESVAEMGR